MELASTLYCEKYGILDSEINGKYLSYITSHFSSVKEDCCTYKVTVNLEEMKEIERKRLKYYYKKGEINMYL